MEITNSANKSLYKWKQPKAKQVIRQDTAYIINDILSDPNASYMNRSYKFQNWNGWKIAAKTGTTNDNFDGLMTAWNTQYAVASWVGHHTRTKALTGGHMEYMTAPLTRDWMQGALSKLNTKPVNWEKPAGVKTVNSYVQRSHVGSNSIEPGPTQDLFPSWYVGKTGTTASATIDKVSGGLATSCTPDAAKETVGGANDNTFSADDFYPVGKKAGSTSTTTATADSVHKCDDSPPQITLTADSKCTVGQNCQIRVVVTQGTHPLGGGSHGGTVTVSVNGNQIGSQSMTDSPSTLTFDYTPNSAGTVQVTATATDSVLYQATSPAAAITIDSALTGVIQSRHFTTASYQQSHNTTTSGGAGDRNKHKQKQTSRKNG
jgi:hypothetical protein